MIADYQPTLQGKLRREVSRLAARRPAAARLQRPMVSFTFDDVPLSAVLTGAGVLEDHGVRGTFYVCAGLAGQSSAMGEMASAADLKALADRGHEIACHTYSHLDCGVSPPDEVRADIERNAEALAAWGLPAPSTFAYPYGEVSAAAKGVAGCFGLARSVRKGILARGGDLAQAPAVGLVGPSSAATASRWLERARRARGWIIFYTHDVRESPSAWGTTAAELETAVRAARDGGFDVVTVAEGARRVSAEP